MPRRPLVAALVLACGLGFAGAVAGAEIAGKARAVAGDQLEIGGTVVQLFGLDAPEAADSPDATEENPFADLGLELDLSADALTDESVVGAVDAPDQADVSLERAADIDAASEPAPANDVHEANPFGDIGFDLDFDKVPERSAESVPGLDDMLAGMSAAAAVAAIVNSG